MIELLRALALAFAALFALPASAAVNINTATKDELNALPGIGPAKAQAILDYRKLNGPFKTVDDLKNVKGIGAKRLEKLRADLTVGSRAGQGRGAAPAKGETRAAPPSAKGEVRAAESKAGQVRAK